VSTAGNWWTRPKRSSAAQKVPTSADNRESAPTGRYIGTGVGGSRRIRCVPAAIHSAHRTTSRTRSLYRRPEGGGTPLGSGWLSRTK
jgi:hypothetical protein